MNIPYKKDLPINKGLFFAMLLCLLCINPFYSKGQANFNINVSASVMSSIELITLQSIRPSGAEAVNNIITVDPLSSAGAGKMAASGTPNSLIRINFTERLELTHAETGGTLIFNYSVAGNNMDDQSSAQLVGSQNRDIRFNDGGMFYLWIGGSVDISTAPPECSGEKSP